MTPPLPSPWVAVDAMTDRVAYARALRGSYEQFHGGGALSRTVRSVVSQSWERCTAAGIAPVGHLAPVLLDERETEARWTTHPLRPALPILRVLLSDATTASGHMLVISDAKGVLLWIEGHDRVIEATESMHFVCGADWSESGAGTNALGTAIAVDHAVQIFSAEHFNRIVHPWQCSGSPIHDPDTGAILGVINLTGHLKAAHPHTLSLVAAAAGMAEAFLREQAHHRDQRLRERYLSRLGGKAQASALVARDGRVLIAVPHGWVPERLPVPPGGGDVQLSDGRVLQAERLPGGDAFVVWGPARRTGRSPAIDAPWRRGAGSLRLDLLGRHPTARLGVETLPLSLRHAEILALLALHPRGMTAEQLTLELFGERGKPVTVRAELSRLRRLLGGVIVARPYRLAGPVEVDALEVSRHMDEGMLDRALDGYHEPLLVESEVDVIVERRRVLDGALRHAVLNADDRDLLERWCETASGRDDQHVAELLLSQLEAWDPRFPLAEARVARLRRRALSPSP